MGYLPVLEEVILLQFCVDQTSQQRGGAGDRDGVQEATGRDEAFVRPTITSSPVADRDWMIVHDGSNSQR
jgi:hypothetical protein